MDVTDACIIDVLDESQVGEARRKCLAKALEYGLEQKSIDRVALVVSELATNLVKHTTRGAILVQGLSVDDNEGIELFALDKGPGMSNVQECLRDGFSTVGTLGTGLGAIKRMSDFFDILSSPERGTVVHCRLWNKKAPLTNIVISGLTVPIKGEILSGDKWTVCPIEGGVYCLVVDGLGHGFEAAEAAKLAVKRFKENLSLNPTSMLKSLHQSLRGSRGAVGAVAKLDFENGLLVYAGLGNITGILVSGAEKKHLTSLNGTIGYEARKFMEFSHAWTAQSTLIMHTDGCSSKLSEDLCTLDIETTTASLLAGALYQHHAKNTDDATVLVVKQAGTLS